MLGASQSTSAVEASDFSESEALSDSLAGSTTSGKVESMMANEGEPISDEDNFNQSSESQINLSGDRFCAGAQNLSPTLTPRLAHRIFRPVTHPRTPNNASKQARQAGLLREAAHELIQSSYFGQNVREVRILQPGSENPRKFELPRKCN